MRPPRANAGLGRGGRSRMLGDTCQKSMTRHRQHHTTVAHTPPCRADVHQQVPLLTAASSIPSAD